MSQQPLILLMDEDTDLLERLQTSLQREGYQVLVAVDGRAALRLIKTNTPDLIVSDLLLASLDGYEVWKMIRADKDLPRIPILALSALSIPPNNQAWRPASNSEWQLLSYDAALSKPLDLRRFLRIVKRLLQPNQAEVIPKGPSTVLAIEDEMVRNQLGAMLRQHDFGVETPNTLDKALQLAKVAPPAALILDYRTQGKRVREVVETFLTLAPQTPLVLIVEATQALEPSLQARCHGFLTTPLHPIYTVTTLNQTLEIYNMRQRAQMLSEQLININRTLLDTQQALQAQNEELEHININLRETDTQREKVTSMMVHDLKSPLGSILGTLNFLVTDPDLELSTINENLLNGAIAAGSQMLRMIEAMLDRHRLESGSFEAYQEPFELTTVIDFNVEHIKPFLKLHSLELQIDIADKLPLVYADANITERILANLLDNAIKYSPSSATIIIKAIVDNDFIKVSIEDQGPGIPEDQRADIFQRLTQIKNSDKSARTGFVPSLDFCHLAIEAMGGSMWVEGEDKIGARFVFTLPIYED